LLVVVSTQTEDGGQEMGGLFVSTAFGVPTIITTDWFALVKPFMICNFKPKNAKG
jgi:hypothetical protein